MPDPTPYDGFTVNVNAAEQAAKVSLPEAAAMLEGPIKILGTEPDLEGANTYSAARDATHAYWQYKYGLRRRQRDIVRVVDETAAALLDIVNLYRRADGQV